MMLEEEASKHIQSMANNVSVTRFKSRVPNKNPRTDRNKLSFGDEGEGSSEDEGIPFSVAKTRKQKKGKQDLKKPRFGFGGYQNTTLDLDHEKPTKEPDLDHRKTQKRQFGNSGLSLNDHDLDDVVSIQHTQHLRSEEMSEQVENDERPMYGKESLSKLILEQSLFMVDKDDGQQTYENVRDSRYTVDEHSISDRGQKIQQTDDNLRNDDFIPLDSTSNKTNLIITEPIILIGDEALEHNDETSENSITEGVLSKQKRIERKLKETPIFSSFDEDEGGKHWEDTITRRAGLAQTKSVDKRAAWRKSEGITETNEREKIIANIKNTIASTVSSFQGRITELEQHISRKKQEYNLSMNDIETFAKEQTGTQTKFEYYQSLRNELVTWVGAIRDVTPKLVQIEDAFRLMSEEHAMERYAARREWGEDMYNILIADAGFLDHVIGVVPFITDATLNETTTDEFGRDVGSLRRLARNKRRAKRHKWRGQKHFEYGDGNSLTLSSALHQMQYEMEDSDFGMDDDDLMNTEERRKALSDAVDVVFSELDDHYTSVSKLLLVMTEWINLHPDDFQQCYATLSFSEIIHILARFEICSKVDLLSHVMDSKPYKYIDQKLNHYVWYLDLFQLNDSKNKYPTMNSLQTNCLKSVHSSTTLDLIIRKTCIPYIISALSRIQDVEMIIPGPYEWLSYRQSSKMSSFYSSLYASISDENRSLYMKPVWEKLLQHLRLYIDNHPTFLVTDQALKWLLQNHNTDNEKGEAIIYAAFGQIYFWKKVLINSSTWAPILTRTENIELAHIILEEVVSRRVISLLTVLDKCFPTHGHSLEIVDIVQDTIRCTVSDIYEAISTAKWLEYDELLIVSAPLRAMRHKYMLM